MKYIRITILFLFTSLILSSCVEDTVTVSYSEYENAFRNPMKGFREYYGPGEDRIRDQYPYPYGTMIKEYIQWNMIENESNDGIDKIIDYCNHRWKGVEDINMKIIPRVFIVWVEPWHGGKPKDTNNPDDLNGWHWPDGIPPQISPYKQIPGSVGAYVDPEDKNTPIIGGYFDPAFPERVTNLIEKIGKAWDNDPRVAYVEMGIIGEWGEHHDPDISTYWPPHDEPEHVDNRTWLPGIEKVLGDAFTNAFKNKKVMVRYAYEFKEYEFGIYWDSWSIDEEIVRGYEEMKKLGDRWKTQPIGGEITWNWGSLAKYRSFEEVVINDKTRDLVLQQIRDLHCNHLGGITWANFDDPEFIPYAKFLQKTMGYRFVLSNFTFPSNIKQNEPFSISFDVANIASSPFYYDWPVEISLLDSKTHEKVWGKTLTTAKISQWMPGDNWDNNRKEYLEPATVYHITEDLIIDTDIEEGEYIISISVLDPAGMLPSLRFANENYFEGGYHPMGYIGINMKPAETLIDKSLFFDIQSDKTLRYKL